MLFKKKILPTQLYENQHENFILDIKDGYELFISIYVYINVLFIYIHKHNYVLRLI